MLLAIDIGNTNIVYGVYDHIEWRYFWRVQTIPAKMPDEYGTLLRSLLRDRELGVADFDQVILSSVVPVLTGKFTKLLHANGFPAPVVVSAEADTGLCFRVDNPAEVGADLIANAVAAYARFGGACIVVDFGTATTLTAVSAAAEFLGVAIAPGLNLAASTLAGGTAQLPAIELAAPARAIGVNTGDAIRAGIVLGYVGLVEGLIGRIRAELGGEARVLATGGLSRLIAPLTTVFDAVDVGLTLEGLRLIAARQR